jgi:hypothetical protein
MGLHPKQIEIFRRMSPEQKLALAERLWTEVRELKRAYLRQLHPDWTEEHVQQKLREIFLHAGT